MVGEIYKKGIIWIMIAGFAMSCAPKYSANFQLKSHKMDRYAVEEVEEKDDDQLVASIDKITVEDDVTIKEIVTEPGKIKKLMAEGSDIEVIKPGSGEELIQALKDNPNATVAIDMDELTRKEKRTLKKEVKKQLKETKEAGILQYNEGSSKLLYIIIAIFIPPLAVALWRGIGKDFWINLLLTILFLLPGIIHGIIVISTKPKTTGTGAAY